MLSLFPSFLTYGQLGPFLLRLTLGAILLYWAYGRIRRRENGKTTAYGVVEAAVGVLLVIGLFTQLAALIALVVFLVELIKKARTKAFFTAGVNYYFILLIISLSILVLGPGAFAFDLPL